MTIPSERVDVFDLDKTISKRVEKFSNICHNSRCYGNHDVTK